MEAAAKRTTAGREMRSLVNWALLGLVIDRPSYGLELANRFERVYGEALSLSGDSHVYAALDALEGRGMIEIVPGTQLGRQPKTRYRATESGLRQYEERLVDQADVEARRQELWVRQLVIFARNNPEAALRVLDRFQQRYLKRAGEIGMPPSRQLIDELVSEQQRRAVGAMLSWLRYAHKRLEELASGKPVDESART